MKRIGILSVIMLISVLLSGQNDWIFLNQNNSVDPEVVVLESSGENLVLKLTINSYKLKEVETPKGTEFIPVINKYGNIIAKGIPSIPLISQPINIPDVGGISYEIISYDHETLSNINIAPSKGSILRTVNPDDIPYTYGKVYEINEFFPKEPVTTGEPYIIRNLRGCNINFTPFSYNPVSKELKIFKEIIVRIRFTGEKSANIISGTVKQPVDEFENIYRKMFINYRNDSKYTPIEEGTPGKMLIIANDNYASAMKDFIDWKNEKGIETEMVLTSAISSSVTSAQIKSLIQDYYDNDNLSYVLLVGDGNDVPSMKINSSEGLCASDNSYTYLAGSDKYADIFIGRFSGNSLADIQTQVDRTIHYEKNMSSSDTWLENAFGSASSEGQGGGHNGGESDVTHMNNIRTDLQNYGYTVTHVNETGGSNAQISAVINSGVGVANYIGHGGTTEWVNTMYSNTHVNALTNENKLPFIWSVACINGNFDGNTCFAEAWLRAQNNGNPTGAIAFLGSTINQTWTEPMTGQDEMVDILVESYTNNIKRTFGGISFNGMFKMIEGGGYGQEMADTWTVFGDPSFMVRTKTPSEMVISHNNDLSIGNTTYTVSCDTENALACLTLNDDPYSRIIGYAYVSNGTADIPIPSDILPGELKLTVTAYNKVTFQTNINVIVPEGPYVANNNYVINDEQGNNNGQIDYNEIFTINQSLKNVGVENASNVSAVISTTNESIQILTNSADFGNINIDQVITVNNAFKLSVPDGITDQTLIPLKLNVTAEGDNEWEYSYVLKINAPELNVLFSNINDTESGNSNGHLDVGETAEIIFSISNNGHSSSVAGIANLTSTNEYITINTSSVNLEAISANASNDVAFEITIMEDIPDDMTEVCFNLIINSGAYGKTANFCFPLGLQIEDWESNNFDMYEWRNNDIHAWTIVSNEKYEGDYSARSGNISHNQQTSLSIHLNVIADDEVTFYKKVSCENVAYWGQYFYDYLAFYIDGDEKGKWAGEVSWSMESYNVSAGRRELKWTYLKDGSADEGSDCAWIDYIKLPAFSKGTVVIHQNSLIPENKIDIFPNPANNLVNIGIDLKEDASVSIRIININGQIIYESYMMNLSEGHNTTNINTESYKNGYYFVEIITNDQIHRNKLIINK